jgi:hypothetical protein
MTPQKIARLTGLLFLVTFLTSIPALLLYDPILKDGGVAAFLAGEGADGQILLGAALEMLLIVANIGTALVLFPLLRRQNETLALGFVVARVVESAFIAVGVLGMLSVVTLRQDVGPGALGAAQALVAVKDWTFGLGPGFVVGIGNGLILGYLMYTSGLIPRRLAAFGLVGGPLVSLAGMLVLFGVIEFDTPPQYLFSIPEMIWEAGILGIYLIVKGFRPSAITGDDGQVAPLPALAVQPA